MSRDLKRAALWMLLLPAMILDGASNGVASPSTMRGAVIVSLIGWFMGCLVIHTILEAIK